MEDTIVSLLGGRIAEKLVLDDISTGASNDIQRATSIARAMVTKYGMSDKLGPIVYDSDSNEVFLGRDFGHTKIYSEKVASIIDDEVKRIIDEAYLRCEEILKKNMDILEKTASYLLDNETMDGETFKYLCDNRELPEKKEEQVKLDSTEGNTGFVSGSDKIDSMIDEFFGSDEGTAQQDVAQKETSDSENDIKEKND